MSRAILRSAILAALVLSSSPLSAVADDEANGTATTLAERATVVKSLRLDEAMTDAPTISTKVGWVSTITLRKKNGTACGFWDIAVGSKAFQVATTDAPGAIEVHPQRTGASTNLNVTLADGSVRTFVLNAGTDDVDAWVDVRLNCD